MLTRINGLVVSELVRSGSETWAFNIDYGLPDVEGLNFYIDPDDRASMQAWRCLAHDWGLYNLYWWIEREEDMRHVRHDYDLTRDKLKGRAKERYECYDTLISYAIYGKPKGYAG